MTNMILNTAEPMTPLMPISSSATKTPMTTVANSGAEEPAAMNVAPATSGVNFISIKKKRFYRFPVAFLSCALTFTYAVKRRNKIIIANDRKPYKRVNGQSNMNY